ncbi:MAG: RIP metalloprotease RseP [Chitinophagales bacterium]|nr:RIP metalloprotease RseP [Saprospiraceae bacterium]MBK7110043.1 RIP metalloprotease RseP [Bacteroidota bacterium]MBP7399705.1 RIP metalloprotease RseP [Chitinophagales bacterium]MBK8487233.1 RIP metalloprotease RseP [Bacteroidota bacterium]MBK8680619.1 RIP metalloprotease RseP [Bacteroidota bacterium]
MVIVQVAQLVLSLTILVFIHELGHFLAARMFGIRVEKFYIFFDAWGKKIVSWKRGDTEYGIGWLPLGGYVKIVGMIDESMDKKQMAEEPQPYEFRSKPNWQKFIVMIAGIVMNIILGIVIYTAYHFHFDKYYTPVSEINKDGIYAWESARNMGFETGDRLKAVNGKEYKRYDDYISMKVIFGAEVTVERNGKKEVIDVPNDFFQTIRSGGGFIESKSLVKVDSLTSPETNAAKAGLLPGDQIVAVDGNDLFSYGEFKELLQNNKNGTADIEVLRNDAKDTFKVDVDSAGLIGFVAQIQMPKDYDSTKYTVGSSITYGSRDAFEVFYYQAVGLWKLVSGQIKATESIQSPIGITSYFPKVWDWRAFWRLTALLSMVLAFMNLLPIPALDGGHIMFIGIESIMGRKLSDKFMERAQIAGMVLLLSLMVFAVGNDLFKIFSN